MTTSGSTTSPRAPGRCASCSGGKGAERRRDDPRARPRPGARPGSRSRPRRAWSTCAPTAPSPTGWPSRWPTALARLEERAGKRLGDAADPLLVSVRSGARESMPGMLDTVLNLGLNDESVQGLATSTEQRALRLGLLPPLRADVRQRLARDPGRALRGRDRGRPRTTRGVKQDTELDVDALKRADRHLQATSTASTPARSSRRIRSEQLRLAIRAVFDSWVGDRAVAYRRLNRIPDDWGTAVNVQQMVFGNKGETSGSGVAFSRDEVTGAPEPSGDFLPNAQGEDVVSGVRTPRDIAEMEEWLPEVHAAADGDPAHARAPLRGHAGHRVHGRGGPAVHAPDAQRQAARPRPRCGSPSTPSTRGC